MKKYTWLFGLIILLTSCGKDGLFSIFDDQEHLAKRYLDLSYFNYLKLNSTFEVYLQQDTSYSLTIEGDESVIAKVSATINGSALVMDNNYRPKWLKPKSNKVKLYLKFDSLNRIDIIQPCNVQSVNTLTCNGLGVIFHNKLGEVNLNINCNSFYYWNDHPCGGRLTLSGFSKNLTIWNFALMSVDAGNLNADVVSIENHAQGNCWVRAIKSLTYSIFGTGNIYYLGKPDTIIDKGVSSSGQLLNLNP